MNFAENRDVQGGWYPEPWKTAHEPRFLKKYFFLIEYQYSIIWVEILSKISIDLFDNSAVVGVSNQSDGAFEVQFFKNPITMILNSAFAQT